MIPKGFTQKNKAETFIRKNLPIGRIKLKVLANRLNIGIPALRAAILELEHNNVIKMRRSGLGRNTMWRIERGEF